MLFGSITSPSQWQPFCTTSIFKHSLEWIQSHAASAEAGIHELGEPGWIVNVHGYTTQTREACFWENHPQTIDIQYMIDGTEVIDVAATETFDQPTLYKPESDLEKFADHGQPVSQLILKAGDFLVLMPGEAHRPKVAVNEPCTLRKLVVKIPMSLLAPAS